MSRRLEIELTSRRPDGSWTWRAAGARQPKGELDGALLPDGAEVGQVLRADAEFLVDGIEITGVLAPKAPRREVERLEVVGTRRDEPLVTTQLAPKGRGRGDRRDRGDRGDRRGDRRDRGGRDGGRDGARDGARGDRRPRGPRPDPVPERPRPKRLRPGRTHRNAVLAEVPAEQRPVAEQVLRGGIPAVRAAIEEQNAKAKAAGQPEVPAEQLVAMAEQLQPKLRDAEWRDRADAALRDLDELDLRDLRSVVVAGDSVSKDADAGELVATLQAGLARRIEEEHANWLADIQANLSAGRFVRALRLTSRPPKAGAPLPAELGAALATAVSEGLTPTTNQDLWAAAVDALAVSPIRNQVQLTTRPETPNEALVTAVRRAGEALPELAALFGVEPMSARERKKSRPARQKPAGVAPTPAAPKESAPAPVTAEEAAPVEDAPTADDTPTPESAAPDAAPVDATDAT
ncbi:MAG: hypothetical protein ACKO04_11845, partial [Actinomycetes bacterium]